MDCGASNGIITTCVDETHLRDKRLDNNGAEGGDGAGKLVDHGIRADALHDDINATRSNRLRVPKREALLNDFLDRTYPLRYE